MGINSLIISFPGLLLNSECFLPDNGLANLAGALVNGGHTVEIWDFGTTDTVKLLMPEHFVNLLEKNQLKSKINEHLSVLEQIEKHQEKIVMEFICSNIIKKIKKNNIQLLGFKLWHGDGFSYSIKMIQKIKKEIPEVKIFAGGPHVDIYQEDIFKMVHDEIEALVVGEGEITILYLAEYVSGHLKLEKIPNIIYNHNGQIKKTKKVMLKNLDNLPFPLYAPQYYPAMDGNNKIKIIVLDETRGCNNHCHFCIHPIKSGNTIRTKSISRITEEIKMIKRDIDTNEFRFAGSNTPADFLLLLSDALIRQDLRISYSAFGHISSYQQLELTDLIKLNRSGCFSLFFGLESGSNTILKKSMNKNFNPDIAKKVLQLVKLSQIKVIVSIIYPAPFENETTTIETLNLLNEIKPDSILLNIPGFFKGSTWAKNPAQFNIELPENFFDIFMEYKLKLMYPPQYWEPLHYKMNGMKSGNILMQQMNFRKKLLNEGLPLGISEINYSLSRLLNKNKNDLVALWQNLLINGKAEKIQEEINSINQNIGHKSSF